MLILLHNILRKFFGCFNNIMLVLRDEMLAVFLAYLFYYMAARLGTWILPTSINLTLR